MDSENNKRYGNNIFLSTDRFITGSFTMIVAMSLAEICSAYPTTGGKERYIAKFLSFNFLCHFCVYFAIAAIWNNNMII